MPRAVDHEIRRSDLVRAFWRVVERGGVETASMRMIAAEAGVSLGMLQHYFTDKDEILVVAIRASQDVYRRRVAHELTALGEAPDPRAVLALALRGRLPLSTKQRHEAWVLLRWFRGAASTSTSSELLAESQRFVGATVTNALEDARRRGMLARSSEPQVVASLLVAFTDGLLLGLLFGRFDEAQALELLDAQLDLVLSA
jgi:TetR/AcrR family transcriptional repressor of bet genes